MLLLLGYTEESQKHDHRSPSTQLYVYACGDHLDVVILTTKIHYIMTLVSCGVTIGTQNGHKAFCNVVALHEADGKAQQAMVQKANSTQVHTGCWVCKTVPVCMYSIVAYTVHQIVLLLGGASFVHLVWSLVTLACFPQYKIHVYTTYWWVVYMTYSTCSVLVVFVGLSTFLVGCVLLLQATILFIS